MRYLFFLLCWLVMQSTQAMEWDGLLRTIYRSYPRAAVVEAEGGMGFKLWQHDSNALLYGYVRPNINFQTSVVTNKVRLQIDIFPISFFGFVVGIEWNKRDYEKFSGFTCSTVNCSGQIRRSFIGHKMALAYKKWFLMSQWKLQRVEMTDRDGIFADVYTSLLARSRYDQNLNGQLLFGHKVKKIDSVGILYIYNSMKYLPNISRMYLGFYRHQWNKYTLLASGGYMHTRNHRDVASVLLLLQYNYKKGLALF